MGNSCQLKDLCECTKPLTCSNGLVPLESCGHYYHFDCIQAWAEEKEEFSCPVCDTPSPFPQKPETRNLGSLSLLKKRSRSKMLESCVDRSDDNSDQLCKKKPDE